MRQVFIKWFYGFSPERRHVVTFVKGQGKRLVESAKGSDAVIVHVGTKSADTDPENRGRLLGMVTFEDDILKTEKKLDLSRARARDFKADGTYRWPEALQIVQAWRFLDKPLADDILSKPLPSEAAWEALELPPQDAEKILAFRMEEVPVKR